MRAEGKPELLTLEKIGGMLIMVRQNMWDKQTDIH